MRLFNCLQCGKEKLWHRSSVNKFCDNKCQGIYKWENVTKPSIERGERGGNANTLKKFLREIHGDKCSVCGQESMWNNKPLILQLDHIDGDSDNNHPSNIRLLCPNCHTQTENFGCKGQGNRYRKETKRNKYLQEYKTGD